MTVYLFKSIACLTIFLLVYRLFLEKEKMYRFNRWYLLGSLILALLAPYISFSLPAEILPSIEQKYFAATEFTASDTLGPQPQQNVIERTTAGYLMTLVWTVYFSIAGILLIRFIRNLYYLQSAISKNTTSNYEGATIVLLKDKTSCYSFLNYIFISEEDYLNHSIEKELLTHELTHVKEKHSWDIIFIELIQIFFWFNPTLIFYKQAIQLNHEYLADEAVVNTHKNIPAYQYLLLDTASRNSPSYLTSNFNYSVTKKRFIMMTTTASSKRILAKQAAVVPLLGILLFLFASKTITAQDNSKQENDNKAPTVTNKAQKNDNPFLRENFPQTKEGVSKAEFDEYFAIEQKYFDLLPKGYKNFPLNRVSEEDRKRLESIFLRMNREQQMKCHVIFLPPLTPSKSEPPTQIQLDAWKNGDVYGVWIGDRKIKNEELNNYSPSDFSWYNASKLYPNARKNVKYKVQVTLFTNEEFRKMNEFRKKDKRYMIAVYWPDRNRRS